jgi:hypothetical protein
MVISMDSFLIVGRIRKKEAAERESGRRERGKKREGGGREKERERECLLPSERFF